MAATELSINALQETVANTRRKDAWPQTQSNGVLRSLRYFTHSRVDIKKKEEREGERRDIDKNDAIEAFIFQTI